MNANERRAELAAVGEVLALLEQFVDGLRDVLQRYDIDESKIVRRVHLDDTLAELRATLAREWLELERRGEEHE